MREVLEAGTATKIKEAEARKEAELDQKIKDAEARAAEVEVKVSGLEREIEDLKKQLAERRETEAVIADFKESTTYDEALNKAAAAEVIWYWHVAEKHIKTDPVANLKSFIDLYIEAKNKITVGK